MENKKLYGRYDEKAGTYTLPKGAPTDLESIKLDIENAIKLAAGKKIKFIHEGNGAEFPICQTCSQHTEEAFHLYNEASNQPNKEYKTYNIPQGVDFVDFVTHIEKAIEMAKNASRKNSGGVLLECEGKDGHILVTGNNTDPQHVTVAGVAKRYLEKYPDTIRSTHYNIKERTYTIPDGGDVLVHAESAIKIAKLEPGGILLDNKEKTHPVFVKLDDDKKKIGEKYIEKHPVIKSVETITSPSPEQVSAKK